MKPGSKMPPLGFGTWKLQGEECAKSVKMALDVGYRHVDTAHMYNNHEAVAAGIKGFPRDELFLVSKLYLEDLPPEKVKPAVQRFLEELQTDYLDLLLIHWPSPEIPLQETLKAMLEFRERGMTHEIGVSNFVRSHLEAIAPFHFPIFTNQIEVNPFIQRKKLTAACRDFGIPVTAHRPLAYGHVEEDETLHGIAKKHGKSASQVTLRWLIQLGFTAIPKAANPIHIRDNFNIFDFELDAKDLEKIAKLDAREEYSTPEGVPFIED